MDDLNARDRASAGIMYPLPKVRALLEMPGKLAGVGMTCRSVLVGAGAMGTDVKLFTSHLEGGAPDGICVHEAVPPAFRALPHGLARPIFSRALRRDFIESFTGDEVAYLWPSADLSVYEQLAERGIPVVAEAVNTRMAVAREILDQAYEGLGLRPSHGITDERIAVQDARNALCTAIFAPSPAVEQSFAGTGLETRLIPASYGTWVPKKLPPRPKRDADAPIVFLFVGRFCVRKGAHHVLEAWRNAPKGAILRVVGEIEPAIRKRFGDVIEMPNVSCAGFSHDVAAEMARADAALLPSLEEGDPISTYEAASHGLPVIASAAGAGRIGAESGAISIVDPADTEAFRDRLAEYARSEDIRRHWGALARAAALDYDWSLVAPRRMRDLAAFLRR